MKQILTYLTDFFNQKKSNAFLFSFLLLLISLFTIRYVFHFDIYFIANPFSNWLKPLFYTLPIVIFLGCIDLFTPYKIHKNLIFIGLVSSIIIILTLIHYYPIYLLLPSSYPNSALYFTQKILFNLHVFVIYLFLPLMYILLKKSNNSFHLFGLLKPTPSYKPYLFLVLISIPFIFCASLQPAFHTFYPRYKPGLFETFYTIPNWLTVGSYQITYIFQFVGVELFFRGFLIFVLARYIGLYSVFFSVICYVLLHFGKPFGEAFASLLGGTLLGIISYKTQSIRAGIIIHVSIALLMEFFAFIHF